MLRERYVWANMHLADEFARLRLKHMNSMPVSKLSKTGRHIDL